MATATRHTVMGVPSHARYSCEVDSADFITDCGCYFTCWAYYDEEEPNFLNGYDIIAFPCHDGLESECDDPIFYCDQATSEAMCSHLIDTWLSETAPHKPPRKLKLYNLVQAHLEGHAISINWQATSCDCWFYLLKHPDFERGWYVAAEPCEETGIEAECIIVTDENIPNMTIPKATSLMETWLSDSHSERPTLL